MNWKLASTRVILGCAMVGGLALVACDDEETTPDPTPTGSGTTTTGSGTGGGTPSGTTTGGGTTTGTGTGTGQLPTCQESCEDLLAAGCTGGPPGPIQCEVGCEASRVHCPAEVAAVAACAGADPVYVCDANQNPTVQGCETEYDAIRTCGEAVLQACAEDCPAVVAAGCSAGPPDVGSCQAGCAAAVVGCPAEYDAMKICAGASPTFACDTNNNPYPVGCETEQAALMTCLTSG